LLTFAIGCQASEGPAPRYAAAEPEPPPQGEPTPVPSPLEEKPIASSELSPPPPRLRFDLELPVDGHRPAVVSVPPDSGKPLPVLIAAHGAGDRAEWQCEWWQSVVGARGFVLCPRGVPMFRTRNTGYFYRDHHRLEAEVMAAISALYERYAHADRGPIVYTGYSQGGIMGALFTVKHPQVFSRLILVEGGYDEWDVPTARKYRAGGGVRVLLACGQAYCERRALRSLHWLERAGVEARLVYVVRGGHTYGGEVGHRVAEMFAWVVRDDPRWQMPAHSSRPEQ
jgi:predicted esterase